MITITAHGRLAHQPEIKLLQGGTSVCEFRLLSTRFARGQEHVEAVTFFLYGEDAERFCESAEKGQEISATGTQETQKYTSQSGEQKTFVKYRCTWFQKGRKPFRPREGQGEQGSHQSGYQGGYAQGPAGNAQGGYQSRPPAQAGGGYGNSYAAAKGRSAPRPAPAPVQQQRAQQPEPAFSGEGSEYDDMMPSADQGFM